MLQAIQEPKVPEDGFTAYSKKAHDITGKSFRSEKAWCNSACARFLSLMPSAHGEHWIAVRISRKKAWEACKNEEGKYQPPECRKITSFLYGCCCHEICHLVLFILLPNHWEILARGEMWVKLREIRAMGLAGWSDEKSPKLPYGSRRHHLWTPGESAWWVSGRKTATENYT